MMGRRLDLLCHGIPLLNRGDERSHGLVAAGPVSGSWPFADDPIAVEREPGTYVPGPDASRTVVDRDEWINVELARTRGDARRLLHVRPGRPACYFSLTWAIL